MPTEPMILSNHLILCCPLLLLSPIFPSIRAFSNELAFCIRWPKDWTCQQHLRVNHSPGKCLSSSWGFWITSVIDGFFPVSLAGSPSSTRNPVSAHCLLYLLAAAAKSLQSCPTLCNPIHGSPSDSPDAGILQATTLEWAAISFSNSLPTYPLLMSSSFVAFSATWGLMRYWAYMFGPDLSPSAHALGLASPGISDLLWPHRTL